MKNPPLGALSLLIAATLYGFYGIFSRLIGSSFGNFNQNWIRNLIVLALILIVIAINKTKLLSIQKKDVKWILLWFLCGSWATVFTFIAFNNLQIGTTYLVLYSTMILSGFLSGAFFFKEKITTLKLISLICCFIGLFIIYRFTVSADKLVYVFLTLTGGLMTGVWNTISKKFSDHYHNNQIVMMDAIATTITALIGALLFKEFLPQHISSISWMWISIYAVVQTLNIGLIVYGFKNIEAQIGSIILPVEIVFAAIFTYLIFNESPSSLTIVGGLFILTAAIIPSLNIFKKRKNLQVNISSIIKCNYL